MNFISPTKGLMSWDELVDDLLVYIADAPELTYKIIIGTDSQVREETCFVTAVVVHRVGKGARYYYRRRTYDNINSMRQRIFMEAATSLETASKLTQCSVGKRVYRIGSGDPPGHRPEWEDQRNDQGYRRHDHRQRL